MAVAEDIANPTAEGGTPAAFEPMPVVCVPSIRVPTVKTRRKSLKTDTVVVSDIHLGSEVCRAKHLRRALAEWFPFRRLIVLGDLFDDLNFKRLKKNHFGVLDDIRRLTKPKRGVVVDWVEGNHDVGLDRVIPHLIGARIHRELLLELHGRRYLFIHGHQFDGFLNEHPVATAVATKFYEAVQRREGEAARMSRWLKRQSKQWVKASMTVEAQAREYGRRKGVDAVLCGHTHYDDSRPARRGEVEYHNTGSWTDAPSTLTTIDEDGVRRHLYS